MIKPFKATVMWKGLGIILFIHVDTVLFMKAGEYIQGVESA